MFPRPHVRQTPTLALGSTTRPPGGDHLANRRNPARRSPPAATDDGRQLSFAVRDAAEQSKLALQIPPPRSYVSEIRRLDLATRLAWDLGELAAELVTEDKLGEIERRRTPRTKERTR